MATRHTPEAPVRAVRTVIEHHGSYKAPATAIAAIAPKIGCIPQTMRGWIVQAEKDSAMPGGMSTDDRDRMKTLERAIRKQLQATKILRKASPYFSPPFRDCAAITFRAAGPGSTVHSRQPIPLQLHSCRVETLTVQQFLIFRQIRICCVKTFFDQRSSPIHHTNCYFE